MSLATTEPGSRRSLAPVEEPIFLVGTGRCGSTILYHLLSNHRQLGWISSWVDAFPARPWLAGLNRVYGIPGTDPLRQRRFLPKPVEPGTTFATHVAGYPDEIEGRPADAEQATAVRRLLTSVLRAHGKPRFLGKFVGRPAPVTFLDSVYPHARYVHIRRELKPTVASLLKVEWYDGTGDLDDWPWGTVPGAYLELWRNAGRPEGLAATIKVLINLESYERQLDELPRERVMNVDFGVFVETPREVLAGIMDFLDLPETEAFRRKIARYSITNPEDKWRSVLTPDQLEWIEAAEEIARGRQSSARRRSDPAG